jgi:Trk-type K+ transport system membrane component
MTAFNQSPFILLSMGLFILAGNTCFPVFLRLFIWTLRSILSEDGRHTDLRATLEFLLLHPRRCYTNLFPGQHTWWLFVSVMVLNGIDCAMYAILSVCL